MVLKLYNTRTRQKEEFRPLDPDHVRMYVCGPTVYDYAHIGNARPVIVFDVLFRLLRHLYGPDHVTYVRNITDVDDKINARAAEQHVDMPLNEAIRKVTEETGAQFQADVTALGCLEPTVQPRATEHIEDMKRMIETLVEKGHAYAAEGHVLFNVKAKNDYGQLARRSIEDMQSGARVEVAPYKRDPLDFVLWKPSKQGEPAWPSPCGIEEPGRPGWHIECSAMSDRWLWENARDRLSDNALAHPHQFDIHGGGIDIIFPHHENEVAQSRCAHGTDVMAQVWMHNGMLQVEGQKMSKSLGNFFTINEVLQDWPGGVFRFNMLRTHYRQPIDWTFKGLEECESVLRRWHEEDAGLEAADDEPGEEFLAALLDDLNTPLAITTLHQMEPKERRSALAMLGLEQPLADPRRAKVDEALVEREIAARIAARKTKNWAEADRIRDELVAMGIVLMDGKDPETGEFVTRWEIAR